MTLTTFGPYLIACILLTIAPGPDNILVVSLGLSRGRKPAVLAAWGMVSGILVHTAAASLGISAVLATSPLAFRIIQYAGAAYLIYLAWRLLRERSDRFDTQTHQPSVSSWSLYRRGFLMNVLNPKVALFFLAFLPQFVHPEATSPNWLQMFTLGFIFMAQAFVIFTCLGLFAGGVGELVTRQAWIQKVLSWLAAGVFVALALALAVV